MWATSQAMPSTVPRCQTHFFEKQIKTYHSTLLGPAPMVIRPVPRDSEVLRHRALHESAWWHIWSDFNEPRRPPELFLDCIHRGPSTIFENSYACQSFGIIQSSLGSVSWLWWTSHVLNPSAGVTVVSTNLRRRPNAFNLVHQCEIMLRAGYTGEGAVQSLSVGTSILQYHVCWFFFKIKLERKHDIIYLQFRTEWHDGEALDSAAAFASAYSVGRLESQAATNLLNNVAPWVRAELKEMVRPGGMLFGWTCTASEFAHVRAKLHAPSDASCVRLHGQPKFLLHDGIAAGIFNSIYNRASAGFVPWDAALQNNNGVLGLLLNRMKKDFEGLTPKMRKPWGQKELEPSFHLA